MPLNINAEQNCARDGSFSDPKVQVKWPRSNIARQEVRHLRLSEDDKNKMIASREARTEDCTLSIKGPTKDEPGRYFDVMLRLEDRLALRTKLEIYCTKAWFEWSENEKPRRRSIAIDQRLFEIAQRLLQSGGQESVELIWGLGLARIRPRATGTRFELRASEKLAAERLALTEDAAKRCLRSIEVADSEGASPAPSGRR